MSESSIAAADQAVYSALAASRAASISASGQALIDRLLFLKSLSRQIEHDQLQTVAQLDSDGVFAERGMRTRTSNS
jgi:hypothetical protein